MKKSTLFKLDITDSEIERLPLSQVSKKLISLDGYSEMFSEFIFQTEKERDEFAKWIRSELKKVK